jgi:hypothetical protein
MLASEILRTQDEATGDKRVIPFLLRFCRWLMTIPFEDFLPGSWQKWRGGDLLDSVLWLYNRTGESWLIDLARIVHERTADWTGGIPTWHGVNICQGFRQPAQFWQVSKDIRYLQATIRNYETVMGIYGQGLGGMFAADENCRPGYTGPQQAAETCSMAEFIKSHAMLVGITGDGCNTNLPHRSGYFGAKWTGLMTNPSGAVAASRKVGGCFGGMGRHGGKGKIRRGTGRRKTASTASLLSPS